MMGKGPLHTRVKSCDHDIVRAQKKVSKGRPKTRPKSRRVVTDPKWSVKSCVTGPSTTCYFNESLFTQVLTRHEIH